MQNNKCGIKFCSCLLSFLKIPFFENGLIVTLTAWEDNRLRQLKQNVFKGAQSRRFHRFLVKTVLKFSVANFIYAQHCV